MKKLKLHQLQLTDSISYEPINLQLVKQNKRIHSQKKNKKSFIQKTTPIYRSQRRKTEPEIQRQYGNNHEEPREQNFSFDLKFKRCKTLQNEQKKRVRSRVQQQRRFGQDECFELLGQSKKGILRAGPLIYIKDMLAEAQTEAPQKPRLLRLKIAKSQCRIKEEQATEQKETLNVAPLKISIGLPRILQNCSLLLKYQNQDALESAKKILQEKSKKKRYQKYNFNDLSPWATKSQSFNNLER